MSDVIISGGGLVGLAFAAALDSAGLRATLVDPADPDARANAAFDGRTSAVSSSSRRMFEVVGIAPHFPEPGNPIRTIKVADGLAEGGLAFEAGAEEEPLGWMHENRHLREALLKRARAGRHLDLRYGRHAVATRRDANRVRMTLDDGSEIAAPLLVGAEGRNSPTREAAGIRVARWKYDHHAIVSTLAHARPHGDVAWEIFYPGGPFALLPMTDLPDGRHRSALVWSVPTADSPGLLKLPDEVFAAEAERAMGGFLGAIEMLSPRSTYPLGFHHTARLTAERMALIGDAAHGIHPIAGQGVNLGYRDAAALAEVLVEGRRLGMDPGDAQLLERYERWRSLDTLSVAAATDGLTRLYGVPGRTASMVRRLGMGLVNRFGPLKEKLKQEAQGTSGDLPLLLRGLPI
ncbi:UbiH/UbiF/VisC/COQ6 family ubiquinone biosynthesis hydroxylase [Sphingomicrobium astaxanthinifaciens]|uniref:UbiH/UbiF/VisC/COQ6 family ubiquinone biosynthesis hydroxylase n=1 Tax=Sphingomicrobium astaxanthinifaciens TaxID=1227949 RepID=UPI001FCC9465|nr:UbiH/UbiF/VisC/COQ6 family ubiquinone biosynthesis hydroxylase [Sphingomicrobium astaxanthinifaciens]MCJ7421193.1 UbiH/UbiF/VisC/COQ6 family ubiquinone biosynthesis hydroxylase [Sphingomicrobium astaxanthinifaciens]